ncbi:methyl-accepting chemotaxis protein [Algicola sagamiensis]|uniref:methyl-accepting chemotaxis protein n=1 Tax=Algicola sagamiensis TaxID=163869 RepID=UPI0003658F1E|nr:HAMP domain-containing methyl-accepting chemotaxis protein [Algicola sagamiensis]
MSSKNFTLLIKHKLIANVILAGVGMLAMLGLLFYANFTYTLLNDTSSQVSALNQSVLMLRRHEKDFMARKDLKYKTKFDEEVERIKDTSDALKEELVSFGLGTNELNDFNRIIKEYSDLFHKLVQNQQAIGMHPKDAKYGTLRKAVHNVEQVLKDNVNYQLLADMLQLRRNEKDFMLRHKEKYLGKFDKNINKFKTNLEASFLDEDVRKTLSGYLDDYLRDFRSLVEAQKAIGLDEKSGILGELRTTVSETESQLSTLSDIVKKRLDEKRTSLRATAFTIFLIVLVSVMIFNFLISRSVLIPLGHVSRTVKVIREHDDLTKRIEVESKDELGVMSDDVNSLLDDFRELILRVGEAMDTLNRETMSLADNSVNNLEAIRLQSQETDSVATAVEEMGATIREIAQNTEFAADRAKQSNENATIGQKQVDQTVSKIDRLSDRLEVSSKSVTQLAKDSENIGAVMTVIRGIAEQTNLLALNAAIEAARAGEQGRGFAVVADEVRSLALRTQESTQEIENIITSLQSQTREIVELIQACQKEGQDSVGQAQTAGQRLQQINEDVNNILDMNTQIASAIEEQSQVAAEVGRNVVKIRDVSEDSHQRASENASSCDEVAGLAQSLQVAISKFKY